MPTTIAMMPASPLAAEVHASGRGNKRLLEMATAKSSPNTPSAAQETPKTPPLTLSRAS